MHNEQKLTNSIYWIGANDFVTPRFENYIPITQGVSYNSYFIDDEKTCVIDTVDQVARDLFMENVKVLLKGRHLDYIVVNHIEPDHSGSLVTLLETYPEAKICITPAGMKMFGQYFHLPLGDRFIPVNEKLVLNLGTHTLRFITAPMVHWPEVTFTYEETEKILFSADLFGTLGALQGSIFADSSETGATLSEEMRTYYMTVIGRYGRQVTAAMKKTEPLLLEMICPLHGPVYRTKEDIKKILKYHKAMASWQPEYRSATIFFASPYGNTAFAAQRLAFLLGNKGIRNIKLVDLCTTPFTSAWAETIRRSHIVLSAPTMDMGLNPLMKTFLSECTHKGIENRTIAVIGNSSWAPYVSMKLMKEIISEWKNCRILGEGVHILSNVGEQEEQGLEELADIIAEDILNKVE